MKEFCVTFIQRYSYMVEAHDEDEAFDKAEEVFETEMHRIVNTTWDDWEMECVSDDGDDDQ